MSPPGAPSDFQPCSRFEQGFGCHIIVTPDGRNLFFASEAGPLYRSRRGVTTPVSIGPNGEVLSVEGCNRLLNFCHNAASDDGKSVAFESGGNLYLRSGDMTKLVASSFRQPGSTLVYPDLYVLSPDGSRLLYFFGSFSGCDCPYIYEYDGKTSQRFPSDEHPARQASATGAGFTRIEKKGESSDGRRVFFTTDTPLVPEDTNATSDVYERTASGEIKLISDGTNSFGAWFQDATPDGSHVLFTIGGNLYERVGDTTQFISKGGSDAHISADGSRVFFSTRDRLVPGDTDMCQDAPWQPERPCYDVYEFYDGKFTLVSTGPMNANGPFDADFRGMSADGRHVFFVTRGALVSSDTDSCTLRPDEPQGCLDVYDRDVVTGETRLVSTGPTGRSGSYDADFAGASTDGRRVLFSTREPLVSADQDICPSRYSGDGAGCPDIYERFNGTTTLVSTGPTDNQSDCRDSNHSSGCPAFIGSSSDGRLVFFQTNTSLVSQDTDGGLNDVYVSGVATQQCRPKQHGKTPNKCWAGSGN